MHYWEMPLWGRPVAPPMGYWGKGQRMTVFLEHPPPGAARATAGRGSTVLVVSGFAYEGRLTAGPGITTILAGGDIARLRAILGRRMQPNFRAVISFGVAG